MVVASWDRYARWTAPSLMDGTTVYFQNLQHTKRVSHRRYKTSNHLTDGTILCRSSLAHIDVESVEIGVSRAARSTPMNMPLQPNTSTATRPLVPVLIESGSCSKSIIELKRWPMTQRTFFVWSFQAATNRVRVWWIRSTMKAPSWMSWLDRIRNYAKTWLTQWKIAQQSRSVEIQVSTSDKFLLNFLFCGSVFPFIFISTNAQNAGVQNLFVHKLQTCYHPLPPSN